MHWRWLGGSLPRTAGHVVSPFRNYATRSPPTFTQQQKDEARHLLRAILREASYVPDEQARKYIQRYAVNRFKDYNIGHKDGEVLVQRRNDIVEKAKKQLRQLIRANMGELKPFQKVLSLAYGRTGRRRRELLKPLVVADDAPGGLEQSQTKERQDVSSVGGVITKGHKSDKDYFGSQAEQLPVLNKKLMALLRTGLSAQMSSSTRFTVRSPRQLDPRIPELNAWLKPMPENRVKNMTKKWYGTMLDQILPPIPDDEYDRLKSLALGLVEPSPSPKTRAPAKGSGSMSNVERSQLAAKKKISDQVRGHTLTSRFLQRQYAVIFLQMPRMDWDNEYQKWTVEWGRASLRAQVVEKLTVPSKSSARPKVSK